MTWYAIHSTTNQLVAEAEGFVDCSDRAMKACPWGNDKKGEVAPYFLTTLPPHVWAAPKEIAR